MLETDRVKRILALAAMAICASAESAIHPEVTCFTSGGKAPIRFELRSYFDDDSRLQFGFVRYAKSTQAIPLVFRRQDCEEIWPDRPHQCTANWLEVLDGQTAGSYQMVWQGASVLSMDYTRKSDGKSFSFFRDDSTDFSDTGCQWSSPESVDVAPK